MTNEHLLTVSPTTEENWHNENVRTEGLLLHDYFSAKAMAAIISNPSLIDDLGERSVGWIVGHSRAVADAMIKARG
ncbi:hypothetical protein [Yersinia aldovae]|uniref:hypothetical protein n=1 Tax=Yersinia aldovae TaxID=29483 RepID=UPI00119E4D2F|nr:hypothetical protein [Yersinia aldovae]